MLGNFNSGRLNPKNLYKMKTNTTAERITKIQPIFFFSGFVFLILLFSSLAFLFLSSSSPIFVASIFFSSTISSAE